MNHPLTKEMMNEIHGNRPGYSNPYDEEDMQAAANWQLEQVVEWLQSNLWLFDDDTGPLYIKEDCLSDKVIDEDKVINDLRKAMRPQQQENN